MRNTHQIWLALLLSLLVEGLWGQIGLQLEASGLKNGPPAYATAFSPKDQKTQTFSNGKAQLELLGYTSYIIVVYQKGRQPHFMVLDTEGASRDARYTLALVSGRWDDGEIRPAYLLAPSGLHWQKAAFDLDRLRDKPSFGASMVEAHQAMRTFYTQGKLPQPKERQAGFQTDKAIKKTEHEIGQQIYHLLQQKRAMEERLEGLEQALSILPAGSWGQDCKQQLELLSQRKQYAYIKHQLAQAEWEKVEVSLNYKKRKGQTHTEREREKALEKMQAREQELEVAQLHWENKEVDCGQSGWEQKMTQAQTPEERDLLLLQQSNWRLAIRKRNAFQLQKRYNEMALGLKGRERLLCMAQAQKFVADHAKADLAIKENQWQSLLQKRAGQAAIQAAQDQWNEQHETAFQAEMSYLEHMWHLRSSSELGHHAANQLYQLQNQLLDFQPIQRPTREKTEDFVPGFNPLASLAEQARTVFDSFVKTSQKQDSRGTIQEVEMDGDSYEIVVNQDGYKHYYKNGKPITSLTYRFETVAKYGAYLDNIRIEEPAKRSKFISFFTALTDF